MCIEMKNRLGEPYFEGIGNGQAGTLQHEDTPGKDFGQLIPLKDRLVFPVG